MYTPPSAPVTRPTGIWNGANARADTKSANTKITDPSNAECHIAVPGVFHRRRAICGATSANVDLSAEQLDQADADYLFYGVQGGDESKLTKEALWSTLKAVTEKHAHSVDADMFFLNAGPAAALGVLETIKKAL